jgi:hypothetical protein
MERAGEATGSRRRTWYLVFAAFWAALAVFTLTDGRPWLGTAMLAFAVAQLVAYFSPRVAAWGESPLFRWKK